MIQNRKIALAYRIFAFTVAVAGFLAMSGIMQGAFNIGIMMFYTMQSNLIGIALIGILIVKTIRGLRTRKDDRPGYYPQLEMVVAAILFITFLVYWVMLAPRTFMMANEFDLWSFGNLAVHGYTPLLVLLDYILFTPPGHLRYQDIYYIAIYPLAYVLLTSIAGLLGYVYYISPVDGLPVRFPYFFFDFDRIGALSFVFIGALVAFFLLIGHIFYAVDRRRLKRK